MWRTGSIICIAIWVLVSLGSVRAVELSPFPIIPRGAEFCLSRQYDEGHLRQNPKQLVTSIQFMGRNAWRTHFISEANLDLFEDDSSNLDVSVQVRFRDTSKELVMTGSCWPVDKDEGGPGLRCKFRPYPTDFADMIGQGLYLKDLGKGRIEARATSDWKVVRVNKEPESYAKAAAEDRLFILSVSHPSACNFPRKLWSKKGPTKTFTETLP